MIEDLNNTAIGNHLYMIKNQFELMFTDVLLITIYVLIPILILHILILQHKKEEQKQLIFNFKNGENLISDELHSFVINNKTWKLSEDEKFVYRLIHDQIEIRININNLKKDNLL